MPPAHPAPSSSSSPFILFTFTTGKGADMLIVFIVSIPDNALDALPLGKHRIYFDKNFRLDLQGVSYSHCGTPPRLLSSDLPYVQMTTAGEHNLQVQINIEGHYTTALVCLLARDMGDTTQGI
jgi:hypothetical protein